MFGVRARAASLLVMAGLWGVACGSASDIDTSPDGAAGASAGGSAGGAGAPAGGAPGAGAAGTSGQAGAKLGCAAPCGADQACSVTGACIAKGSCAADGDCTAPGTVCDAATHACVPGGGCGAKKIAASEVPSNLLMVVDRSCSMLKKLANGKTKWEMAVAALSAMTKQFDAQIRFGLTMFPDRQGDKCTQESSILVPIGDSTSAAISSLLQASLVTTDVNYPDGPCSTSIDTGILQSNKEPGLFDPAHPPYALLLTDGAQSTGCNVAGGAAGAEKIITNMKAAGIAVFVVGFGDAVNEAQLDAFAKAGGVPAAATSPMFYKAEDDASLAAALSAIAGKATGCVFSLDPPPPDASQLYVFFDKAKVPRDPAHAMGWDYDSAKHQVTVYGGYCDQLKAGKIGVVDVVYGCDKAPE
ncbi:MAG: VWA domain-containing protein [Polyangiaceae bacterium]|nr:VWA domain-containing protein [Polyangiaceae bacterium]